MARVKALTGNSAAATGAALCRPGVIAAYPITPQSSVVEALANMIAGGQLDCKMVEVESEHSACSVVSGASLAGERAFTATSAQGLALMYEPYFRASTLRLPIVMPIACREMTSPSSIWCGQQDAMTVRDAGWMQIYVEDNQEILDMIIQGYRVAEDDDVMLPLNICYDGFYLSHQTERVEIPDQETVDAFLPKYKNNLAALDPNEPMAVDPLTEGHLLTEYRRAHIAAMQNAFEKLEQTDAAFRNAFGRSHGSAIECYRMDGAELALVTIGSMTGAARVAVDAARENGIRVGLVKLRMMRPFPKNRLADALRNVSAWAVIDRSVSFGWSCGPVYVEMNAAIKDDRYSLSFVGGLGGADITVKAIGKCISLLSDRQEISGTTLWMTEDFVKEA